MSKLVESQQSEAGIFAGIEHLERDKGGGFVGRDAAVGGRGGRGRTRRNGRGQHEQQSAGRHRYQNGFGCLNFFAGIVLQEGPTIMHLLYALAAVVLALSNPSFAASPYVGEQTRTIKALSDQEIADVTEHGASLEVTGYRLQVTEADSFPVKPCDTSMCRWNGGLKLPLPCNL